MAIPENKERDGGEEGYGGERGGEWRREIERGGAWRRERGGGMERRM